MLNLGEDYLAVILAGIINMFLGFLWYGPFLGKVWIKEMKISKKDMEKAKKEGMAKQFIVAFVASLIIACVLSIILNSLEASSVIDAILISILIWFGFFAAVMLNSILWEGKSIKLYLINSFYYFVSLIIMSIVIVLI